MGLDGDALFRQGKEKESCLIILEPSVALNNTIVNSILPSVLSVSIDLPD